MHEEPHLTFQRQGIEVDRTRIADKAYLVKKTYQVLTNAYRPPDNDSFHLRIGLVGFLEKMLHTDFKNTADMNHKIEQFLQGYDLRKSDPKVKLRQRRKKQKLTQQQLAEQLGYSSHVLIAQMENGKRRVSGRVLDWLDKDNM